MSYIFGQYKPVLARSRSLLRPPFDQMVGVCFREGSLTPGVAQAAFSGIFDTRKPESAVETSAKVRLYYIPGSFKWATQWSVEKVHPQEISVDL